MPEHTIGRSIHDHLPESARVKAQTADTCAKAIDEQLFPGTTIP